MTGAVGCRAGAAVLVWYGGAASGTTPPAPPSPPATGCWPSLALDAYSTQQSQSVELEVGEAGPSTGGAIRSSGAIQMMRTHLIEFLSVNSSAIRCLFRLVGGGPGSAMALVAGGR